MYHLHFTQKRDNHGLTKLEIISIFVIFIVAVAVAVDFFTSYKTKSKMAEAETLLPQIFNAQVIYYEKNQTDASKGGKTFLTLSAQPPQPGMSPQPGNFSKGDWSLLGLNINKPVYYSYSVETSGSGEEATFTVIARGDLDGDQHFSRWEMRGSFDPNGKILGKDLVYSLDPFE
jgi:hypothetical protein